MHTNHSAHRRDQRRGRLTPISGIFVVTAIALGACGGIDVDLPAAEPSADDRTTTIDTSPPADEAEPASDQTDAASTDPLATTAAPATTAAAEAPTTTTPVTATTEPATAWPETSTVEWFDHSWAFSGPVETATDSDTTRIVSFELRLRNLMTDQSYGLPTEWIVLRSTDDEVFRPGQAWSYTTERYEFRVGAEADATHRWYLEYEVPKSVSLGELRVVNGADPDRRAVIRPDGIEVADEVVPISLATTSWDGEYSWNGVTLVLMGATAGTSAGRYDGGGARPAPNWGNDRQANEAQLFVRLDFDLTEYSTSGVGGVNVNEFCISADGTPTRASSTHRGWSLARPCRSR